MSWQSPISMHFEQKPDMDEACQTMSEAVDNYIVARVRCVMNIDIDKYELARALNYDRNQYNKGYQDGYRDGQLHEAAQAYQDEMAGVEEHIMMDMDGVT